MTKVFAYPDVGAIPSAKPFTVPVRDDASATKPSGREYSATWDIEEASAKRTDVLASNNPSNSSYAGKVDGRTEARNWASRCLRAILEFTRETEHRTTIDGFVISRARLIVEHLWSLDREPSRVAPTVRGSIVFWFFDGSRCGSIEVYPGPVTIASITLGQGESSVWEFDADSSEDIAAAIATIDAALKTRPSIADVPVEAGD